MMQSFLRTAALGFLLLSGAAQADVLVVDRGLPTANLNNAAGSNRSNVTWAIGEGYFIGDSFTLGGAAGTVYTISQLQTWVVSRDGTPLSASLFTGIGANADLALTSSTPTFTAVTYANGSTYQGTSGAFRPLYQVDFTGLNIVATAGTTISFGVDGINPGGSPFFNHASNAALSGSPQNGADNIMSYYFHDGTGAAYDGPFDSSLPPDPQSSAPWDKTSDINVRVFAAVSSPVPEPASWAMMIAGFGAVGATMRRRKVAVRFA